MRWSQLFIPTLRESPADAEAASHRLLARAGYIRQLSAGLYSYLLPAQRSLRKIQAIVREEMETIGAQEVCLPALQPVELWQQSGRGDVLGETLFRLRDRAGRPLCLGMAPVEAMGALARGELRSYKQLPQFWYQLQAQFRDEARPHSGFLRARQFWTLDAYSIDIDADRFAVSYQKHRQALQRVFDRCGLPVVLADSQPGRAQEFLVVSEAGDQMVVRCAASSYAATLAVATARPAEPIVPDPDGDLMPEAFHTPNQKTIADIAAFTGLPSTSQMKSLVMMADGRLYLLLLRGDHTLSEAKFAAVAQAAAVRPALADEIRAAFGADPGSLGPVGVTDLPVLADLALRRRRNMISGANRNDYHLRHVTPGEDFQTEYHDLRQVTEGDTDTATGEPLTIERAFSLGHITPLSEGLSHALELKVSNEAGGDAAPLLGAYGLGIERILCAAVELFHDADGMALPAAIAPFDVVITPINIGDAVLRHAAESLYEQCRALGLDTLLDDRDERPGVKFKDADLIGIPYRLTIGGKKLAQGLVEAVVRRPKQTQDVEIAQAAAWVKAQQQRRTSVTGDNAP